MRHLETWSDEKLAARIKLLQITSNSFRPKEYLEFFGPLATEAVRRAKASCVEPDEQTRSLPHDELRAEAWIDAYRADERIPEEIKPTLYPIVRALLSTVRMVVAGLEHVFRRGRGLREDEDAVEGTLLAWVQEQLEDGYEITMRRCTTPEIVLEVCSDEQVTGRRFAPTAELVFRKWKGEEV